MSGSETVSIPFKRESRSKVIAICGLGAAATGFQFPSNGKADPKSISNAFTARNKCVSIPFKRESRSKESTPPAEMVAKALVVSIPFKRESRSKGPDDARIFAAQYSVSIPFKRESRSKDGYRSHISPTVQLVSIPFKRESRSKVYKGENASHLWEPLEFQFPSNGKADPKPVTQTLQMEVKSFNSLQTGKQIQRPNTHQTESISV